MLAGVAVADVGDRAGELARDVGDEHLPAVGRGAHARRRVHRLAGDLPAGLGDFAGVEPDAHLQRRTAALAVERVEGALDRDRAGQRALRRHEHDEEPVAERGVLVVALVLGDLRSDQFVVLAEQVVGLGIAQRGSQRSRALDVGEHDRHRPLGQRRSVP